MLAELLGFPAEDYEKFKYWSDELTAGLALNATEEPNGSHHEELEQIRELIVAARDVWLELPEVEDETDRRAATRTAVRLIQIADTVAVTST